MLDLFRKHAQSWFIKVLFFIIVVVFVLWGGYSYNAQEANQMARIGDHYISISDYNQSYNQLLEMYKQQMGDRFNEELLRQLNLKQQALDMLINRHILTVAARDMGLKATSQEIQQKILEVSAFQTDGKFDQKRYVALLLQNRLTPEAFEEQVAQDLSIQKVEEFVKRRASVTEDEIRADFQFNYKPIQLGYVTFEAKSFEDQVKLEDAALQAFFQENQERYKEPEKRQFAYVFVKADDHMTDVQVSEDEIKNYFEDNKEEYRQEQEVKAGHILFKVDEKAPEAEVARVKAEAQKVLDEAKKGKNFSELAKKHSQDPSAAQNSGDLGYFTREQMVPEFSDAAFAMKPGEISDLVRAPFGFHIIKVEDVKPAKEASLEEVRGRIETALKTEKAKDKAFEKARSFSDIAFAQKDIEKAAQSQQLKTSKTEQWVEQTGSLPGVEGADPEMMGKLFGLSEKDVSNVLETPQGFVVAQVMAIQPPQVPPFEKVKQRVEKDYKVQQARTLAREKASELLAEAKQAKSLEQASGAKKLEYKTSDWFTRQKPDKDLRLLRGEPLNKIFTLNESQPFPEDVFEMGFRVAVVQFLGEKTPDEESLKKERDAIANKLTTQKQAALWQGWMEEQRNQAKVEILKEL
jgi:peptidyl-prolyl cis-trans isomerase D